jgi:hypothetical protein
MLMDSCYKAILNECIELVIWAAPSINIGEVDNIDLHEFEIYRKVFKEKFDAEAKNKQEFIKNTFEFARKSVEVICKTIAGAFGTKTNTSNLK